MQTVDVELFREACAFTLTLRQWGNRRQGNLVKLLADSGKPASEEVKRLKLTKQLIESPEFEAICEYQRGLYEWCVNRSMPSFFKAGLYLVKISEVPGFEAKLKAGRVELADLIAKFQQAYPKQVEEARNALNGQFDSRDYPAVEALPSRFGIEWNWIAFGVPDNLPAELKAAEAAKIEKQFAEATTEIMFALREGFGKILDHVTERLTVEPGDKPKVFRDTLFEDLTQFIDTFNARNLVNDRELAQRVESAKGILAQVRGDDAAGKAQVMREATDLRARTAEAFASLKTAVAKSIAERPSRKFSFDE